MTNITITTETDSDWIGDIPDNWSLEKLKYIFSEKKSTSNSDLKCGSISFGKVIFKDDDKVPDSTKQSYQEVLEGEFLINPLNLNFDLKSLRIGLSKISVVVSQGYIVLKINDGYLPSYYEYLLRKFDVEHMKSLGQGVRQTISFTHIKDEKLVVPPLQEQKLISRYLDKKTEQIDSLIDKIQKKIELLKEQRTSLINQCVTKGLDPNVEMKDSGVEWIGEIPKHWMIKKLKHLSIVKRGSSPRPIDDPRYFHEEGEFSWVRISDVTSSTKYLDDTKEKLSDLGSSLSTKILPGDIFLSIAGSVGKPIITNIKCCIHDGFVWFQNLRIEKEFLYYLFLPKLCFQGLGKLGTQLNLNTDTVGDVYLPLPSKSEQSIIIEELESNLKTSDHLLHLEECRVLKLYEYRQSLISSVVTGQVRVTEDMV